LVRFEPDIATSTIPVVERLQVMFFEFISIDKDATDNTLFLGVLRFHMLVKVRVGRREELAHEDLLLRPRRPYLLEEIFILDSLSTPLTIRVPIRDTKVALHQFATLEGRHIT
jgi:hypothetical protein